METIITTTPGYLVFGDGRMAARNAGWAAQCVQGDLSRQTRGVYGHPTMLKPDFPTGGSVFLQERST